MANSASAKKRVRQSESARAANASMRTSLRSAIKKVKKAILTHDKAAALAIYQSSVSILDRMSHKRIIHPGKGARLKSNLSSAIKKMEGPYSL